MTNKQKIQNIKTNIERTIQGLHTKPQEFIYEQTKGFVKPDTLYSVYYTLTKKEVYLTGITDTSNSKIIKRVNNKTMFSKYSSLKSLTRQKYPEVTPANPTDSDYRIGNIKNSKFINIDGDAIDTSGSNVEIFGVKILNVGDKGISAGEESIVTVSNILIDNAKIGIASKDSSKVLGNNLVINNSREFDLASYNKKKIFGGGSI